MAQSFSFDQTWASADKAIGSAFSASMKRFGLNQDPKVALYAGLTPEDFQDLSKDFGETSVLQYIQEMEKNRLMQK